MRITRPQINFREPKVLVRSSLGLLLLANLITAVFAFHLIGDSPSSLDAQLTSLRAGFRAAQAHLNRTKTLVANIDLGKEQGDKFLASYMTSRRHTFSTILGEISGVAKTAGMKMGDANYAVPDPIEGSEDLDMLTITANFEGTYPQLLKFVNLLDRSPRFLLIEGLQVTPQPKGDLLSITIKMNTFVKDDKEGAL
jgi:type IV pilus assembly protein PilO